MYMAVLGYYIESNIFISDVSGDDNIIILMEIIIYFVYYGRRDGENGDNKFIII